MFVRFNGSALPLFAMALLAVVPNAASGREGQTTLFQGFPVYPPNAAIEPDPSSPNVLHMPAVDGATKEGLAEVTRRASALDWTLLKTERSGGSRGKSVDVRFARVRAKLEVAEVSLREPLHLVEKEGKGFRKAGAIGRSWLVVRVVPIPPLYEGFPVCADYAREPVASKEGDEVIVEATCAGTDHDKVLPAELPVVFGWQMTGRPPAAMFRRQGLQVQTEYTGKLWLRRLRFKRVR